MSSDSTSDTGGLLDSLSHSVSALGEKAKEALSGAQKEGHKEVAKGNTDASLADRASAGAKAVGDKIDETTHGAKADLHEDAAKA